jgi:hypothetical protein
LGGNIRLVQGKNARKSVTISTRIYTFDMNTFLAYTEKFPLRSPTKKHRLNLIPIYFQLKKEKAHLAKENTQLFLKWKLFCQQWFKYAI